MSPQYPGPPPGYGYGYPGPAYPPARRTSGDAVAALVLALISWTVCPIVTAIIALVLAGRADRTIKASGGWVDGAGMVTAARVIAWIQLGLAIAGLVLLLVLFVFGGLTGSLGDPGSGTSI